MNLDTLALIGLLLAALPCALFLTNLLVYRRLPACRPDLPDLGQVSVLIPARNEEHNLPGTLQAALANTGCDFEVIVLDDHSTDRTRELVTEQAVLDPRLRLESAPPLELGWCGKPHACQVLGGLARHSLLLFIDADVRLAPGALARMVDFMKGSDTDLASGVPQQELATFSDRLLLPLIHFVLLGFLPLPAMRRTRLPSMSAGCGQLFLARRDAYQQCGGHSRLRDSLHDGLKLPRVFRQAGFRTDLFDATDLATCRMYQTNRDTWRGLAKNATEGLAAPGTILPMTAWLFGGQVLPFGLLALPQWLSPAGLGWTVVGVVLAYLPRFIAARRFRQPLSSAWLHPLGVLALLAIQWLALARHLAGKPAVWKGRAYGPIPQVPSAKVS